MGMTKNETKQALIEADEAARQKAREDPTPENRELAVKASANLSAWIMANDPPKRAGYASRAGKRQAAERRSLHKR